MKLRSNHSPLILRDFDDEIILFSMLKEYSYSLLDTSRMKHKFTTEEDSKIGKLVATYGLDNWATIADLIPNRSARQIKERWFNYLCPLVNRSDWTSEEEEKLLRLIEEHGKKWRTIAKFFNGRTDVNLKNRYRLLKRRERNTGSLLRKSPEEEQEKPKIEEETPVEKINVPQAQFPDSLFNMDPNVLDEIDWSFNFDVFACD